MTTKTARSIVLLSGGVDSVTAYYDALESGEVVAALSFDYGSKHNRREIAFAAKHAESRGVRHVVIPLEFMNRYFRSDLLESGGSIPQGHYEEESMKSTVVPFRNGIMLAIAAGFAESVDADSVIIAAHGGDHAIYPDCRQDFMKAMGDAMRFGTYPGIKLLRPFIDWKKQDIVARGITLGIDYAQTWSCYVGGEMHCGKCGTCVERREAFVLAGAKDPVLYQVDYENQEEKPQQNFEV